MSWLDRIENQELEIITGDGQVFTPIWKTASRSLETNTSRFDFLEIDGTLIRRGNVSGTIFPFEIHFQGENNIEESTRFLEATKDKRAWTIRHPLYDEILCHPSGINFDDSNRNVTIVTGEWWETIEDIYPDSSIDIKEDVLQAVEETQEIVVENFGTNLGTAESSTIANITENLNTIADKFRQAATTETDLENVENAIGETLSALNSISSSANIFMTRAATLLRTPAKLYESIETRINLLQETYDDLKNAFSGLINRQDKLYFESASTMILAAKAETSVLLTNEIAEDQDIEGNNIVDYETRKEVLSVINNINTNIDDYFLTLGNFQTENSSTPTSYIPSSNNITSVKKSVVKATGQLLKLATESKQERIYTVPKPTSLIILVHRLLGTTDSDEIQKFAKNNEILLNEWLLIPKGRQLKYYI